MNQPLEQNQLLEQISAEHGTPCYVYFADRIYERADALRQAFGGRFCTSYAVKANPNPVLLSRLHDQVDYLDVSSAGEMKLALAAGWGPDRLTFTGPGKRDDELRLAVGHNIGAVVLESVAEAEQVNNLAAETTRGAGPAGATGGPSTSAQGDGPAGNRTGPSAGATGGLPTSAQGVLIRINPTRLPPGFGVRLAGRASRFGIDDELMPEATKAILCFERLDIRGFHVFSGSQCLDAAAVAENIEIITAVFGRWAAEFDIKPALLVFGAGIGIPYHEGDKPLDLKDIAEPVNRTIDALRGSPRFAETQCSLELGRFLVGQAGIYVTRVLRVKHSRGTDIAICDGGMHHHLAAAGGLGSIIPRNFHIFKINTPPGDQPTGPYDLAGPLCTSIDTLGRAVELPKLSPGDLIGIKSSGAYGLSASPVHFLNHEPPKEILVETQNGETEITDVTVKG